MSYITDDRQLCQHLQYGEPDPDILRPLRHRPPRLADKLLAVQPDLHPVVDEGKEGGQGEGGHENGDEAELQNWKRACKCITIGTRKRSHEVHMKYPAPKNLLTIFPSTHPFPNILGTVPHFLPVYSPPPSDYLRCCPDWTEKSDLCLTQNSE